MSSSRQTSRKIALSVALLAGAAGVAGLGTYGSFTSTTSASASVGTGTVKIELGAAGGATNRLSVPATGLVPGDTVQRAVTLSNTGNQSLAGITLSTTATSSSKLNTDATDGLQLSIESCSGTWKETSVAGGYTYSCTGTTGVVLERRGIIGQNMDLSGLASRTAGQSDKLLVKVSLPASADNSFQGLTSVVGFDFTGMQRTETAK